MGFIESMNDQVAKQVRVIKLQLESGVGVRIPVFHRVIPWLVRHAAMLRTLRVRGTDGKTAQQRVRGSSSITRMLPFGEMCRYKARAHEEQARLWTRIQLSGSRCRRSPGRVVGTRIR